MSETESVVFIAHGLFYFLTAVWALVGIATFQKVNGPKTDLQFVKTVGAPVSVIGIGLISDGIRNNIAAEIFFVAVGCAAVLTAIDIYYVSRKVVSNVYLLDAAVEMFLIAFRLIFKVYYVNECEVLNEIMKRLQFLNQLVIRIIQIEQPFPIRVAINGLTIKLHMNRQIMNAFRRFHH